MEFADNAEDSLHNIQVNDFIEQILDSEGYYITFNYTHTLEDIYDIPWEQILHIHGEVGKRIWNWDIQKEILHLKNIAMMQEEREAVLILKWKSKIILTTLKIIMSEQHTQD